MPKWLEDLSSHLLNSTLLFNSQNQQEKLDETNNTSGTTIWLALPSSSVLTFIDMLFREWRMWWYLPVFAFVGPSVLSCWNAVALPAVRPFAHERSIGADRSGFKPYWDPTARRLSPLPVSRNSISLSSSLLSWFNWTVPKTWNEALALFALSFAVAKKKRSEETELVRGRCHQSTLPRLFFISTTAGGYPYKQDLILVPNNCECLVTLGQHIENGTGESDRHDTITSTTLWVLPFCVSVLRPHFLFEFFFFFFIQIVWDAQVDSGWRFRDWWC
jgi:hypothetical protein